MNGHPKAPLSRDAQLETFTAELTVAAYRVALRNKTRGTCVDLELDLWKELADTVKTWEREFFAPIAHDAARVVRRREFT